MRYEFEKIQGDTPPSNFTQGGGPETAYVTIYTFDISSLYYLIKHYSFFEISKVYDIEVSL